ncbi:hypothetical protein [Erwinia amylovora]|uniref:Uncharacterized protein n=4 Tax=Erwinia amylovora TaxID=552 RepID=A0A831ESI9_ERWAM|nr:hypothetical protein [Erwinia amylovora]CBX80739.1 hypothetical protein predicted by Glimmer/Critica [Erwinia amylovora ATCC BAA-2158]ATZ11643.1 hypothetical protein AD997_09285 [Erwinia amylovora]EKV54574.1 hypothetical protein EaACW_1878 [Erwinia amylovora ACW56400]MBZ2389670.1 hypothetical protein [Erwinia amylovora]MBZ2396002.1 hypothetical protein [Erwinia amylovora]
MAQSVNLNPLISALLYSLAMTLSVSVVDQATPFETATSRNAPRVSHSGLPASVITLDAVFRSSDAS